jgi:small subunit ribosomal protein S2
MRQYIFTERNGIHIIDLQQTLEALEIAYTLIRDIVEGGGNVLFVGTKRQSQESIQLEAERCGMPYVNARWLGGTLTNWRTIRSRIIELENLEQRRDEGEFELLTKKEALNMSRKINRLEERLGGIRDMKGLPQMLFVVDVRREETAIHEANLLNIPVVALVDTNCDPSGVDYVIPSNDDAIRAIKLLTSKVADAILEGRALRKDIEEELRVASGEAAPVEEVEMSDEELLGEATLAKLQTGEYDEKLRAAVAEGEAAGGESAEGEPAAAETPAQAEEVATEEVSSEDDIVAEEAEAASSEDEPEIEDAEAEESEEGDVEEPEAPEAEASEAEASEAEASEPEVSEPEASEPEDSESDGEEEESEDETADEASDEAANEGDQE